MSDRQIPRAITGTDIRLDHLLQKLDGIATDMAAIRAYIDAKAPTAVVGDGDEEFMQLREPEAAGTPIPDNFPGRAALVAAGIDTLESIPTDGDQLVLINGIGRVTAGQILTWLLA